MLNSSLYGWNQVDLDTLEQLAKIKLSVKEIVGKLDNRYNAGQVRYRLKQLGYDYNLRSYWTKVEEHNLVEYRKQGLSCTKIYHLFKAKFTSDAIRYRARIFNVPFESELVFTNDDIEQLNLYCQDGLTVKDIIEKFNGRFNESTIRYRIVKLGYERTNRYSQNEIDLLKKNCHGKTYSQLQALLAHRTIDSIENKCRRLGLNQFMVNPSQTWSVEDNQLLIKHYPTSTITELCNMFPNKTELSIKAHARQLKLRKDEKTYRNIKKMNSHKSPMLWNENKTQKLVNYFIKRGLEGIYDLFPQHSSKFIIKVLRDHGCIEKTPYQKATMIIGRDTVDDLKLRDIIMLYNNILWGKLNEFGVFNLLPEQIIYCFKYYLLKNNIKHDREFWLHVIFGEILEHCKLKELVKTNFNGYYDFITTCFPKYRYKQWEFRKLDVPNGYWIDKKNCFTHIKYRLEDMIKDKVIKEYQDILGVSWVLINQYINRTIWNYYPYSTLIIEFLDENKIKYSKYQGKVYDGILFDSKEERDVYVYIKGIGLSARKGIKRHDYFYNEKEREGYIPDFLIRDNVIIEYFGLYNEDSGSGFHKAYLNKTNRKNIFYNRIDGLVYIDLYPFDLEENFRGVQDKLRKYKVI